MVEGSDGVVLTESNAIAYYLANDELRGGNDAAARAQVVQWMCMADNEILPASCTWVFPTMGIMQFNKNATDRAKEDVKTALKTLNDHLLTRTFLVGERVTLADIAVACTLLNLYKQVLDPAFRKPFMNVTRWFTTVINQPNAKAVIGTVALCSKMAEFDAKKFAEFSGKGGEKKGKEKAPKAEKKKEPEKKKEKEVEPEADFPAEPKKKDPLDALPKGTFDLEEWKRFYSNNDEDPSIAWFWEHFDHENYSISGIWVFKGQQLAFELSEDWQIDYASYDWKKLDSKSEECKAQVAQYWKWEGKDAKGRDFNQGKILK